MSDYARPIDAVWADLPLGRSTAVAKQREQGIAAGEACTAKAERRGFDRQAAAEVVITTLQAAGGPLTGEQLVNACLAAGHVPHDARAFGPVIAGLVRHGRIEAVGFAPRQKGHGTAGARLWRIKHGR